MSVLSIQFVVALLSTTALTFITAIFYLRGKFHHLKTYELSGRAYRKALVKHRRITTLTSVFGVLTLIGVIFCVVTLVHMVSSDNRVNPNFVGSVE